MATRFPIRTTADLFPVEVVGMGGAPKLREGSKPTLDGEPTYASQCILLIDREGEATPQKSASVHVIKPAATYELGRKYAARGRVFVQPYESNSRVAYSITCEELVPVEQVQPTKKAE